MSTFQGQNGSNSNNVTLNSRIYSSYSDTAMITIGAWNNNLSMHVSRATGQNADGLREYETDFNKSISVVFTEDGALALLEGVKKILIPAIEQKGNGSVSIITGNGQNKKSVTLSFDGKDTFITIGWDLSDSNASSEANTITHKFNKRTFINNYNPTTGEGEVFEVPVDFMKFLDRLESIKDLKSTIAHSISYYNAVRSHYRSNNGGGSFQSQSSSNFAAPSTNVGADDFAAFAMNS